jgi:hypothetical protein
MFSYVSQASRRIFYELFTGVFISDVSSLCTVKSTVSSSTNLEQIREKKNQEGGGNIPLDLQLELYNKTVKEAIKKLGSAASKKSPDRICHSLGVTSELMLNFDHNLSIYKRSGKHVKKSTKGDIGKIVKELVTNDAFTYTQGRKYRYYRVIQPSMLLGFDMSNMFFWILTTIKST